MPKTKEDYVFADKDGIFWNVCAITKKGILIEGFRVEKYTNPLMKKLLEQRGLIY